jgi:hypothetical protein
MMPNPHPFGLQQCKKPLLDSNERLERWPSISREFSDDSSGTVWVFLGEDKLLGKPESDEADPVLFRDAFSLVVGIIT